MRISIIIVLLCVYMLGCVSVAEPNQSEGEIVHVVLIWLHESGNEEQVNQVISISRELIDIPEVQEIRVGRSIPSHRAIVDDSFDVGLYIIFSSHEELQRYLVHPKHQEAVQTVLQPLAKKLVVYDFSVAN
ncbi:MAG: Dabb family protein [Gammaproteobacteria bacterium]|nr:Dabb family protein [Gammaproteobacteria bacterium]